MKEIFKKLQQIQHDLEDLKEVEDLEDGGDNHELSQAIGQIKAAKTWLSKFIQRKDGV